MKLQLPRRRPRCVPQARAHGQGMNPNGRTIDRQRLTPRDYVQPRGSFGLPTATSVLPPGGDVPSQLDAWQQHLLVLDLTRLGVGRTSVYARTGVSSSTFSRIRSGESWARHRGFTALLLVIREARRKIGARHV